MSTSPFSFHSFNDVAKVLGVSVFTVRRLVDANEIRAVNIGASRRISSDELSRIAINGVGTPRRRKTR